MLTFWENFGIIIIGWNALGFIIGCGIGEWYQLNPKLIWEQYDTVNIFGCTVLTIVLNLLCPVFSIGYWFYKLCTVGRKD